VPRGNPGLRDATALRLDALRSSQWARPVVSSLRWSPRCSGRGSGCHVHPRRLKAVLQPIRVLRDIRGPAFSCFLGRMTNERMTNGLRGQWDGARRANEPKGRNAEPRMTRMARMGGGASRRRMGAAGAEKARGLTEARRHRGRRGQQNAEPRMARMARMGGGASRRRIGAAARAWSLRTAVGAPPLQSSSTARQRDLQTLFQIRVIRVIRGLHSRMPAARSGLPPSARGAAGK